MLAGSRPRPRGDRLARPADRDRRLVPPARRHGRLGRSPGRGRVHQPHPPRATTRARSASDTAAILVAHQSNFRIVGFTTDPDARGAGRASPTARSAAARRPGIRQPARPAALGSARDEPTVTAIARRRRRRRLLLGRQAARRAAGRHHGRSPALGRTARPPPAVPGPAPRQDRPGADGPHSAGPPAATGSTTSRSTPCSTTPVEGSRRRARASRAVARRAEIPARQTRRPGQPLGGGTTPSETIAELRARVAGGQRLARRAARRDPPVVARIEDDR